MPAGLNSKNYMPTVKINLPRAFGQSYVPALYPQIYFPLLFRQGTIMIEKLSSNLQDLNL